MSPKVLSPVVFHFARAARPFVTQTRTSFPPDGLGRLEVRVQSARGLGAEFDPEESTPITRMSPGHAASGGEMPQDVRLWWTNLRSGPADVFGVGFDLGKRVTQHKRPNHVMQGLNGRYSVIDSWPVLEGWVQTKDDTIMSPRMCSGLGGLTIYHGRLSPAGYEQRRIHAAEFVRVNPHYRRYPKDGQPAVTCLTFVRSELQWLVRRGHLMAKNRPGLEDLLSQQMHNVTIELVNYRLLDAGIHPQGFAAFDDDEVHAMHAKGVVVSPWLCREAFAPFREHRNLWISREQLAAGLAGVPPQPVSVVAADAHCAAPPSCVWSELSPREQVEVRERMAKTPTGRKVLDAANGGEISLIFTFDDPPAPGDGVTGLTVGTITRIYLKEAAPLGLDFVAGTAVHEGMHALGVAGSRRAEALCRMEEMRVNDEEITPTLLRRILRTMRSHDDLYGHLPWRIHGSSEHFPGLDF